MATSLAIFCSKYSGYTRSFIRRFPRFTTGLSQVVENSIAAALCQQLATGLLKTALLQLCHNNSRQACWKQHCCSSVTTTCNRTVDKPLRTCLDRQIYKASERIQISPCWQRQVVTDLLQICSDLREISCVQSESIYFRKNPITMKNSKLGLY